jgi:hypothetical protein
MLKMLLLRQVSHYTRLGLYPQAIVVVLCYAYWKLSPVLIPGIAVAALGFVAVVMAVRADKFSHAERVAWVVIGFALLLVEVRTLNQDRDIHDAQQRTAAETQQEQFQAVVGGLRETISTNQNHFDTIMEGVEGVFNETKKTTHLAQEGIAEMIGTGSHIEVIPQHVFPSTSQNGDQFSLMVNKIGKHIVWDGEISMSEGQLDESFYTKQQQNFSLKPISNSSIGSFTKIQPSREKENWYAFTFTSRGTAGEENLVLRFDKKTNQWQFQEWLYGYGPPSPVPIGPHTIKHQPWTTVSSPRFVKGK